MKILTIGLVLALAATAGAACAPGEETWTGTYGIDATISPLAVTCCATHTTGILAAETCGPNHVDSVTLSCTASRAPTIPQPGSLHLEAWQNSPCPSNGTITSPFTSNRACQDATSLSRDCCHLHAPQITMEGSRIVAANGAVICYMRGTTCANFVFADNAKGTRIKGACRSGFSLARADSIEQ
jgi:hypothetical protein